MFTDASNISWGTSSQFGIINGPWTNNFELLVIFITLKSLKTNFFRKHARIMSSSATAIAYVNNMDGSRLITCHKLAKQIWEWAKMQGAWILATCIPG